MSDMAMMGDGQQTPLRKLAENYKLTRRQIGYARAAGVRNEAELYSFLAAAPELGERGIYDTPDLSERLARDSSVSILLETTQATLSRDRIGFGATAPPNAAFREGSPAPEISDDELEDLSTLKPGPLASEEPAGVTTCGAWPIRDQQQRGTCVSFAMTAIYELYRCRTDNTWEDLSEQFLYWAIKHHGLDGRPTKDGTWHEFAVKALRLHGTCRESDWPYNPTKLADVSHDPPPPGAVAAAVTLKTSVPIAKSHASTSGKASGLLAQLRHHNGVAIALPVFVSPSRTTHNWGTRVAQSYGFVQNPVAGWVVDGGHAVCCVGFAPDPDEALGGYFIIRNSWGTSWGSSLPDPSYAGRAPGYGQVSASYVDRYLWEDCAC